jgi:hypothetical protein
MVSAQVSLDLFSAVFSNDIPKLKTLLSQTKCLSGTHRGQTLLTLAITLGNLEIVQMLLNAGASTLVKNDAGWNPFQEATSIGDRSIMELIYRQRRRELSNWFKDKGKLIMRDLSNDLNDFYLEMNWSFKSNIPYLSALCPSVLNPR